MSFFANMRAERLIADIRGIGDPSHPESQKASRSSRSSAPARFRKILDALADRGQARNAGVVRRAPDAAGRQQDVSRCSCEGLIDGSPRTVAAVALGAHRAATTIRPTLLLDAARTPGRVRSRPCSDVIAAQKHALQRARPAAARLQPGGEREGGDVPHHRRASPTTTIVPELLSRIEGKDPIARMHIINILSRFNTPDVAAALQHAARGPEQADPRRPRSNALSRMDGPIDIEPRLRSCCATRTSSRRTRPSTSSCKATIRTRSSTSIEVLNDENEYARRAAVEVLNEIGTPQHVKYLLQSIKDDDWWVRSRAADALGKIGGPRVDRRRARADPRPGRGRAPRRHRDPEPDQGRARRRLPDRGHARTRTGGSASAPSTRSPRSAARRPCRR